MPRLGKTADPAEQYHADKIGDLWTGATYESFALDKLAYLKRRRQHERHLRWQDTPRQVIQGGQFCFMSSEWIRGWEMFVEGWKTFPPDQKIDRQLWQYPNGMRRPSVCLRSADVVLVSNATWDYVSSIYGVIGSKITEDDLKPAELYQTWIQKLEIWKRRVNETKLCG
ncbi:hypothetical protein DFQ28_005298 [Apophysomyces sp. BC1034]|nr:hypothetical protein DFQ28_005298 [Apophysomyces sp. BC1034]